MNSHDALKSLWSKVRPILLPYEGMASQVYVFGVPRSELERSIDQFCQRAWPVEITTLNGHGLAEGELRECGVVERSDILRAQKYSVIRGRLHGNRGLQFYIWPDDSGTSFDAEFVFFADDFFPVTKDDLALMQSFGAVYSLAEIVRQNNPECECVLSGSEVDDPREQRDAEWTVFW